MVRYDSVVRPQDHSDSDWSEDHSEKHQQTTQVSPPPQLGVSIAVFSGSEFPCSPDRTLIITLHDVNTSTSTLGSCTALSVVTPTPVLHLTNSSQWYFKIETFDQLFLSELLNWANWYSRTWHEVGYIDININIMPAWLTDWVSLQIIVSTTPDYPPLPNTVPVQLTTPDSAPPEGDLAEQRDREATLSI